MSKGISRFAHFLGYKQDNSFYVQNGNVSFRQFYHAINVKNLYFRG